MGSSLSSKPSSVPVTPFLKKDCLENYETQKVLGKGKYGTVVSACKKSEVSKLPKESKERCEKLVIKESDITDEIEYATAILDSVMLAKLQDVEWENHQGEMKNLVPRFYESYFCDRRSYLVMEKFDTNMSNRSHELYNELLHSRPELFPKNLNIQDNLQHSVFPLDEFFDLFAITRKLDQLGIVHSDLKPDQFIYKDIKNDQKGGYEICIIDLSLVGTYGWASDPMLACPNPMTDHTLKSLVPRSLRDFFNQYQLSSYLVDYRSRTFVYDVKTDQMFEFKGLDDIPTSWRNEIAKYCPNFNKTNFVRNTSPKYVLEPKDFFVKAIRGKTEWSYPETKLPLSFRQLAESRLARMIYLNIS